MTDSYERSVTDWIRGLKQGQADASRELWERYFGRLVALASKRLGAASRRVADEEDVVVNVFDTICRGAAAGRFEQLQNRDDLWRLLVAITSQKVVDQIRRQVSAKRGGGEVRGESICIRADDASVPAGFAQFMDEDPTPSFLVLLDEEQQRLFGLLRDDTQRRIARLRLEGYSNDEIADELKISVRSVERKLGLIRDVWGKEVDL
jgi:RNA polymerase sigma factor (sigma-70 family)